jgi:Ala-tRNA(Pro) deacylase
MNMQHFLSQHDVPFEVMEHPPTYSAQTLAQAVHVTGEEVAKVVLLRVDEDYMLAVLPATCTVDLSLVREIVGADVVELATEAECGQRFSDCELGALPPFGSRYAMKTIVAQSLADHGDIVFEGSNHHEAVRMKYRDFVALEDPLVADFSHHF